jgi:hypothetical protein
MYQPDISESLPKKLHLVLAIREPEVITEPGKYHEGAERDQFAVSALRIGVLALGADGLTYTAFLLRNEERTVFGVKEWLGNDVIVRNNVLEKLAHRVVIDGKYRRSMVSDDPTYFAGFCLGGESRRKTHLVLIFFLGQLKLRKERTMLLGMRNNHFKPTSSVFSKVHL